MAYEWNFDKLPEERHCEVAELTRQGQAGKLMEIHNQYQLSREVYCCSVQQNMVLKWFIYGIESGKIRCGGEDIPE